MKKLLIKNILTRIITKNLYILINAFSYNRNKEDFLKNEIELNNFNPNLECAKYLKHTGYQLVFLNLKKNLSYLKKDEAQEFFKKISFSIGEIINYDIDKGYSFLNILKDYNLENEKIDFIDNLVKNFDLIKDVSSIAFSPVFPIFENIQYYDFVFTGKEYKYFIDITIRKNIDLGIFLRINDPDKIKLNKNTLTDIVDNKKIEDITEEEKNNFLIKLKETAQKKNDQKILSIVEKQLLLNKMDIEKQKLDKKIIKL